MVGQELIEGNSWLEDRICFFSKDFFGLFYYFLYFLWMTSYNNLQRLSIYTVPTVYSSAHRKTLLLKR